MSTRNIDTLGSVQAEASARAAQYKVC
jgi:hypothetical protein